MNVVDLVIIAILIYFAFEGFGRALLVEVFNLLSFLLAFLFSLEFYNFLAKLLESLFSLPHSLSNVLGFLSSWFLIEIIFFLFARKVFSSFYKTSISSWEKFLSVIPALARGVVFVSLILVLTATFPLQPQLKRVVSESKIGLFVLSRTYQFEAPLKSIFGGFTNDTLSFLTVRPKSNESLKLGFKTERFAFDESIESAMIELVNKERVKNGIVALKFDPKVRTAARAHSADMFTRGYFSHDSPEGDNVADRAALAGVSFMVVGENLAFSPSLDLAHKGLMNSPGHRANILSEDYRKIGIGAAVSSEYGIMFTQVFTN